MFLAIFCLFLVIFTHHCSHHQWLTANSDCEQHDRPTGGRRGNTDSSPQRDFLSWKTASAAAQPTLRCRLTATSSGTTAEVQRGRNTESCQPVSDFYVTQRTTSPQDENIHSLYSIYETLFWIFVPSVTSTGSHETSKEQTAVKSVCEQNFDGKMQKIPPDLVNPA